jgi:hypothetical protein
MAKIKRKKRSNNSRTSGSRTAGNPKIIEIGKSTQFTSETAREAAEKSVEARERKRTFKEQLIEILDLPANKKDAGDLARFFGIPAEQINNRMAAVLAVFNRSLKGDPKAFEVIRDTAGEKPVDKKEIHGGLQVLKVDDLDLKVAGVTDVRTDTQTG